MSDEASTPGTRELGERFAVAALSAIARDIAETAEPIRGGNYRISGQQLEDLQTALRKLEDATSERMFPGAKRALRETLLAVATAGKG